MLHKRTLQRDCLSNYSQSFSNLHSTPLLNLDFRDFYLKKSLFNPPEGLAESFAARRHIAGADVPFVEVLHYSKRWLLIQAPRFSRSFFKRLNSVRLGNPYEQLLKIFKSFATLTSIYGYFRPSPEMILMERRTIRVWINEDVFSETRMLPLVNGPEGQRQFVKAFLKMIEEQMRQWQRVSNIYTIEDTIKLLDWRSKINRGSFTAIKASKQVFYPPNQSNLSFEPNELGDSKRLLACRSVQELQINEQLEYYQTDLTNSVNVKEQETKRTHKNSKEAKIFGLFSDSKDLKNSFSDAKVGQSSSEVRITKKKFNLAYLTSTSSTLERFSQKWRSTVGKKNRKVIEAPEPNQKQAYHPPITHLRHQNSEPISIQHEFQGLFDDDEPKELKLGVEGDRQQLQKIAEQIEEVLIW